MVNYKINVYLKHTEMENMYVREFIELVTQDVNGNNFEFTVYEDDNVYDLTNKRVTMVVKSDSGTVIQENCQVVDAKQGKATITLPPDMLIENGPYMAEVQIWEGVNSRVTTLPFDYTVRLSLENDESIKADPRFSLLQVALQNVNDADSKSKEALTISKEAEAICDDLVPKANTASQNAQEALDRALDVATKTELDERITLNDATQTNFNFIENQVVQDGLIDSIGISRGLWTNKFTSMDGCSITNNELVCDNTKTTTSVLEYRELKAISFTFSISNFDNGDGCGGQILSYESNGFKTSIGYNKAGTMQVYFNNVIYNGSMLYLNKTHNITVTSSYEIFLDGEKVYLNDYLNSIKYFPAYTTNKIRIGSNEYKGEFKGIVKALDMYNHTLTPQEIQHNLSVLNNSPSIKELHTTDSTGKTSILKLSSDTDHVEDRAGRTQEQINRTFYKRMCNEIPSPSGEPITVENGEEGYVLSAEIKGQTVKNICLNREPITSTAVDNFQFPIATLQVEANTRYVLRFRLSNVSLVDETMKTISGVTFISFNRLNGGEPFGASTTSFELKNGIISVEFTTTNEFGTAYRLNFNKNSGWTNGNIITVSDICLMKKTDADLINDTIPFGLSSTQASISNNGQSYPIYEPTIHGKTRILKALKGTQNWIEIDASEVRDTATYDYKLDSINGSLGSTPSITDYIDRARKVKIINTKEIVLNGSENWTLYNGTSSQINTFGFRLTLSDLKRGTSICNSLTDNANLPRNDIECYSAHIADGNLYIRLSKDNLTSLDTNGIKTYLASNPITVRYQLATPQEVSLTDEELKAYDAYKKVISCKKVGDVSDTFETREDGSGVVTNKLMNIDFSKGIPNGIGVNPNGTDSDNFVTVRLNGIIQPVSFVGICNKFNTWNGSATYDNKHIFRYGNEIYFVIPREEIAKYGYTGNDVVDEVNNNARRNYLIQEGIQVLYEVAPTTTHIPKELVPTILTHNQTNILEVGGAVKPSSFKVTLPVDRIAELTARLEAVEAKTNTQPVNTAFVDETYAKSVNKIEEVIK